MYVAKSKHPSANQFSRLLIAIRLNEHHFVRAAALKTPTSAGVRRSGVSTVADYSSRYLGNVRTGMNGLPAAVSAGGLPHVYPYPELSR